MTCAAEWAHLPQAAEGSGARITSSTHPGSLQRQRPDREPDSHTRLLALPASERTTLHGEREIDWSHWQVEGGEDVDQRNQRLNFSDPGLLLDAASQEPLAPLSSRQVRGPRWAWRVHRDSEHDPLAQSFCRWLEQRLK